MRASINKKVLEKIESKSCESRDLPRGSVPGVFVGLFTRGRESHQTGCEKW